MSASFPYISHVNTRRSVAKGFLFAIKMHVSPRNLGKMTCFKAKYEPVLTEIPQSDDQIVLVV